METRATTSPVRSTMKFPYIIADIGSNWRGNRDTALMQIEQAAKCGVSAVKFQLFTAKELYGRDGDDTYALPREWLPELAACARQNQVDFMCTAFSPEGVVAVDPYVRMHKVASAEMMHTGILDAVRRSGKFFLVSTGGASSADVEWITHYLKDADYGLLECIASYPAKPIDYNLSMLWIFDFVGVSDHTTGSTMALVAAGAGAAFFEKHFDGDAYQEETPDSPHSIGSREMTSYVVKLQAAWSMMETRTKRPAQSEISFAKNHRRARGHDTFRPS